MRKGVYIIFFLILFSLFNYIPITKGVDYTYVWNTYQVNESTDDACHVINLGYYDDYDMLVIKSNLYDTKTGIIFNNITVLDNATFDVVYLSLYANDSWIDYLDYWVSIYGLDEDNASTFSDFEDFDDRIETSNYVNWNLEDLEGYDTWVNSSNIANILNEVRNRDGWSGGNNFGLMIFSARTWDSYRLAMSYDGNSTYAPKLYVRYRYKEISYPEGYEECIWYKDYRVCKVVTGTGLVQFSDTWLQVDTISDAKETMLPFREEKHPIWYNSSADAFIMFYNYDETESEPCGIVYKVYTDSFSSRIDSENLNLNAQTIENQDFAVDYDSEGTDLSVVYERQGYSRYYYRRGYLNSSDLITWRAGWQNAGTYTDPKRPFIYHLDNGKAVVLFCQDKDVADEAQLMVNDNIDGTWSLGFNTEPGNWNYIWNIMAGYGDDTLLFMGKRQQSYLRADYAISGGWQGTQTVCPSEDGVVNGFGDVVKLSDGNVVLIYGNGTVSGNTYTWFRSIKWTRSGDSWGTTYNHTLDSFSFKHHFGSIAIDRESNIIYFVFYDPSSNYIKVAVSENEGQTWSEPYNVTYDAELEVDYGRIIIGKEVINGYLPALYERVEGGTRTLFFNTIYAVELAGEDEEHYFIYDEDEELVKSCLTDIDDVYDWIDDYIREEQEMIFGNTIMWMIGLLGLIMMPLGFVMFVINAQKGDYSNAFYLLMVLFITGMGLFIAWMWG